MHNHSWFCFALLFLISTAPSLSAQEAASDAPPDQAADQAGEADSQETDSQQAEPESAAAGDSDDTSAADAAVEGGEQQTEPRGEKESATDSPSAEEGDPKDDAEGGKDDSGAQKKGGEEGAEQEGEKPDADGEPAEDDSQQSEKPQEPEIPRLPTLGYTDTPRLPGQPWRVHDLLRPRPRTVEPGEFGQPAGPPSDAVVLFDGSDLSQWCHRTVAENGDVELYAPQWTLGDGFFEVKPRSGALQTLDTFGSCQLHIEWATPENVNGDSQQRGNSGIKLMGMFEIQVLDSYNNRTYADGLAGAVYGQYPPEVTAVRAPGEWQTYDIIFEAPQFRDGDLEKPAYVTVLHNGVLVHHRREILGITKNKMLPEYEPGPPAGPLELQDHKDPVRYRNIWIRPLN